MNPKAIAPSSRGMTAPAVPRRSPFTLLESLVCATVVSLLGALVVPAVKNALTGANAAKCLALQKQLGAAFLLYAEAYADLLPHKDGGSDEPPSGCCWYAVLDPHLDAKPPSRAKQDPGHRDLHSADESKLGYSLKMNSRLEDYKGTKDKPSPPFRRLSTIPDLAGTVLVFDGRCDKVPWINQPYGMYSATASRHGGRVGILFTDAHAKMLLAPTDASGAWTGPGGLLWDPDAPMDKQ